MTWIDINGEVRPQSWEEYLQMKSGEICGCLICARIRRREEGEKRRRSSYNTNRLQKGRDPKPDPLPRMRIRLFRADPHCFWCGIEVVLDGHKRPDLATVDHLYSRWHPERKARHIEGRGVLHVMACSACNSERAACENQLQPFIPKLADKLEFAQLADATIARKTQPQQLASNLPASITQPKQAEPVKSTIRVICTLEEAIKFARENPSR